MLRAFVVILLLSAPALAQSGAQRRDPEPACAAQCEATCKAEEERVGCNPAIGLTSCRIKQDQCTSVCTRKCPRR